MSATGIMRQFHGAKAQNVQRAIRGTAAQMRPQRPVGAIHPTQCLGCQPLGAGAIALAQMRDGFGQQLGQQPAIVGHARDHVQRRSARRQTGRRHKSSR